MLIFSRMYVVSMGTDQRFEYTVVLYRRNKRKCF